MQVLALIPARSGSKGIPGKNLRLLAGRPLIVHTIEQAKQSTKVNRVIVSTDGMKIAEISKEAGAEVPFARPSVLASDDTPAFPVVQHALQWLKQHELSTRCSSLTSTHFFLYAGLTYRSRGRTVA